MTRMRVGLRDSIDAIDDPSLLHQRAAQDGYLFFGGLLPQEEVMSLRSQILEICQRHGWIQAGTRLEDGVIDREAVESLPASMNAGIGIPRDAYAEIYRLELFHHLAHNDRLVSMYRALMGKPILVHPRNIARVTLPKSTSHPTPPHQDYVHIQGTKNVWTAWIPVGNVPRELGGLSVLEGSHRDGLLPVKAAEGAGSLEAYLCDVDYTWIEHDFTPGDVLTFTSLAVHKAIPNKNRERIRISCDFRYQGADEEVEPKSLMPHGKILDWDDIYAGWDDPSLKYYWKHLDLRYAGWDESIREHQEKVC